MSVKIQLNLTLLQIKFDNDKQIYQGETPTFSSTSSEHSSDSYDSFNSYEDAKDSRKSATQHFLNASANFIYVDEGGVYTKKGERR